MLFNVFNIIFLTAFLLSALVQYNDPDPIPWLAIYLTSAVMCLALLLKRPLRWLPALLLVVSLVWIGTLLPAITGKVTPAEIFESISMKTRAVEEAREIGGLAVVALWAGYLALVKRHL